MSLDTQLAIARTPLRTESGHLSRAARQVVPPFLQKLYEIVNDPTNEELIKWSENGDSFYVLNHEKFAREVLGRWFKHQKFASFVRQLNMYGFHKIPHLQQGVLKSDTDTEPWHFEHPNFHRGQPDLLCLIQRKKQPTHGQPEDAPIDMHDPAHAVNPLTNVTPGHLMDINSILNGVAAIKRHQQAISADLSALKQSNDALWKEAVAARQRHAKHQDTINRILKFLAGVFGHSENGDHSPDDSHTPPQVTPRIRQRLMIGDGRFPLKGKPVDIMEVEDPEDGVLHNNHSPFSSERYATIETPDTAISSPQIVESIAPGEAFSPMSDAPSDPTNSPPMLPSQILSRTNSATSTPRLTNASTAPSTTQSSAAGTPTGGQNNNNDSLWQAAFQHMMSSPAQMQRIMQAFANQQPIPAFVPAPDTTPPNATHSALATYGQNQADVTRWYSPPVASTSSAPSQQSLLAEDHSSSLDLLMSESNQLQKSYQDTSDIIADVDMLQSSIDSLIQNLGIDPASLIPPSTEDPMSPNAPPSHHMNGAANGAAPLQNGFSHYLPSESLSNGSLNDTSQPDYLLDTLLSQIGDGSGVGVGNGTSDSGGGGLDYPDITDQYDHSARIDGTSIEDASTEQLTAFLDEASAEAAAAAAVGTGGPRSPKVATHGAGCLGGPGSGVHQKRKSDVADLPLPTPIDGAPSKKTKRKR